MVSREQVVIIGGGMVGFAAAYFLNDAGARLHVLTQVSPS